MRLRTGLALALAVVANASHLMEFGTSARPYSFGIGLLAVAFAVPGLKRGTANDTERKGAFDTLFSLDALALFLAGLVVVPVLTSFIGGR